MKRLLLITITALVFITNISFARGLPFAADGQKLPSLHHVLKNVMPGVVNIMSSGTLKMPDMPFIINKNEEKREEGHIKPADRKVDVMGSGFVFDASKGYIVTNAHVVYKADKIQVTLPDHRRYKAKLIGEDTMSDIAVLQVKDKNLHPLTLGNSKDLKVGDFVIAIGTPFGLNQTVTSGIVSALDRSNLGIEGYENFIQTDAAINVGNSGGALVNLDGQVVGMNTAILSRTGGNLGIAFSIPINMVSKIADQLIKYGKIERGVIGIMVQNFTPELSDAFGENVKGAVVTLVSPQSPAEKAGFKVGDIIQTINGEKIDSADEVRNEFGLSRINQPIKIVVYRDGHDVTLNAKTEKRAEVVKAIAKQDPYFSGIHMTTINEQMPVHGHVEGVQVLNTSINDVAWNSGLSRGDIIVSANNKKIHNIDELFAISNANKDNANGLLLQVIRGGASLFLVIK